MAQVFIGLGSNINPARNVARALRQLALHGRILGVSTVYRTPPEGRPEQPWYFNCVVALETTKTPLELKQDALRRIERELGRVRSADRYAARTIDLDLLLYDDLVVERDDLTLPDPHVFQRAYLAHGVYELAPELALPGSGRPIASVAAALPIDRMEPLAGFTARLRRRHGVARRPAR